jgi:acrylyl-CoA reductase (NADPH)
MCPKPRREEAWARLARELDKAALAAMTRTIALDEVIEAGAEILDGKIRGRVVVTI